MYIHRSLQALLAVLVLSVPVSSVLAQSKPVLTIARFHYPPLTFHPQEVADDVPGYASELAVLAFARSGYEVKVVARPLKRAMAELSGKVIDGVVALNPRDLPGVLFARIPVSALHIACYTRPGLAWIYDGPQSLQGKQLGTVGGYYYADADPAYQKHIEDNVGVREVTGPAAQRALIGMVLAGRIDLFCNDAAHVIYTLRAFYPQQPLRRAGGLPHPIFAYFVTNAQRPGARDLLEDYDRGLKSLYDDGTVTSVLKRYGFFDVEEGESLYRKMYEAAH